MPFISREVLAVGNIQDAPDEAMTLRNGTRRIPAVFRQTRRNRRNLEWHELLAGSKGLRVLDAVRSVLVARGTSSLLPPGGASSSPAFVAVAREARGLCARRSSMLGSLLAAWGIGGFALDGG